ncbi:MAG: hypothetical protein WCE62_10565, partial [Polyangiales bacterium]
MNSSKSGVSPCGFRVIFAAAPMTETRRPTPAFALHSLVQALGGRVTLPLSLIRERVARLSDKVSLQIEPESPGLRVRGSAHALGAPIAFTARVDADGIQVEGDRRMVRIRLSEVELST